MINASTNGKALLLLLFVLCVEEKLILEKSFVVIEIVF
jgi:hypothetical protein